MPSPSGPALPLQVPHTPVPLQYGHFGCSEFSCVFTPVPSHRAQLPEPPQSWQCRRSPHILAVYITNSWCDYPFHAPALLKELGLEK